MVNSEFDKHDDGNLFPITDITPLESEGATSSVYKVRLNGKWHFLKRPKKEFASHPLYIAAFEKEFRIGYTLEHPNIVRYLSQGHDSDGIFLLTEYIDGITLKDFVSVNPHYFKAAKNREKFLTQILSALEYLHSRQILHLDLKPENILITHINKNVKLIDLGFAYNDCYQFQSSGITREYAAPEQLNNGKIDERTDIYALGLILLYVFSGTTDFKKLKAMPYKYRSMAQKCLRSNSIDRFNSIQEVEYMLFKKRHPYLFFSSIVVIGLCIGVGFYLQGSKTSFLNKASDSLFVVERNNSPILTEKEPMGNKTTASDLSSVVENSNCHKNEPENIEKYKNVETCQFKAKDEIQNSISEPMRRATLDSINARAKRYTEKQDRDFKRYQSRMAEIFVPIDSLLQTKPNDGRRFMLKYKDIYRECLKVIEKDSICNEYFKSSLNPFSTYTNELLENYQRTAYQIYNANTP